MARLIGLNGPAGVGKSYCANIFCHYGFERVRFAGPLKTMFRSLLDYAGWDPEDVEASVEGDRKEIPHEILAMKTPRHAMQTLGTEWGRDCLGTDFWVDLAMARVDHLLEQGIDVVMDDVRFPNEALAIRMRGGRVAVVEGRRHTIATGSHVSEGYRPLPDVTINNTGDGWLAHAEVERVILGLRHHDQHHSSR